MFSRNNLLLCGLVLGVAFCIVQAQDKCRACMTNKVQCINKTHFNFCSGTPAVAQKDIYACDGQTVCTKSSNICEEESTTNPAMCDGTTGGSTGGSCDPTCTGAFHCVSTTQFSACSGSPLVLSKTKISCPANEFCSDKLLPTGKMCAPQNILDFFGYERTCENAAPTVAVPTVATTVSPQQKYNNICLNSKKTGSYFNERNVENCRTYIYCEVNTSTGYLLAMLMNCKTGQFYNAAQERCVEATSCPQ